jgi:putative membrane protein
MKQEKEASKKYQTKLIISLVMILLLVIFAVLNTKEVAINFGFAQAKLPLIIVLVVMFLLGAVVSLLLTRKH